jgi:hypothetical protein
MFSMRSFRVLCAATLAAALVPAVAVAAPGEAARPRVVVVNAVDLPDSLADIRSQLRTTLNDAVTKHGFDLAPDGGACADRECMKVAAKTAAASDVLVASGGRNDMRGYHIELRIWNVASDREDNAIAECNICAAAQMVESVGTAADPLLDRVPTLHANLSANAAPPAPEPAAAPAASLVTAPASPAEAKNPHRVLGWSLIGAGVVAAAFGGVLIAINGNHTDCTPDGHCSHERVTLAPGLVLAGVSAAALAGGIVYLVRGNGDHASVALGIQPFGLTLGGRL